MERRDTARAGWGLCTVHPVTGQVTGAAHGPLTLFSQAVGNAEIYAAAAALRMACPPVEIVTDYQHLLDGWELGIGAYTRDGARCGEAWRLFWAAADDFGLSHIRVRKVQAHLPYRAVTEGRISYGDWVGNKRADEEAKKGASLHPGNQSAVDAANDLARRQAAIGQFMLQLNQVITDKGWHRHWHGEDANGESIVAPAGSQDEAGEGSAAPAAVPQSIAGGRKVGSAAPAAAPRELISGLGPAAPAAEPELANQGLTIVQNAFVHASHTAYCTDNFVFCIRCG